MSYTPPHETAPGDPPRTIRRVSVRDVAGGLTLTAACALAVVAIYLLFTAAATAAPLQATAAPYWKTCKTGRRCAAAVIRHVFRGDIRYEMRIVGCETGWTYNARTVGAAGERGLWQIHPVHFGWLDESQLFNPLYNTRIAWRLSRHGRDFSPWTCA